MSAPEWLPATDTALAPEEIAFERAHMKNLMNSLGMFVNPRLFYLVYMVVFYMFEICLQVTVIM